MIDGYAFINTQEQAAVVLDDVVSLTDMVRWGWTGYPELISDEPKGEGEKYDHVPTKHAEFVVRVRKGFKIGNYLYTLRSFKTDGDYRSSRYEVNYWESKSDTVTNPYAIDIITAALSAPIDVGTFTNVPYYGHYITDGGERVDYVSWVHLHKDPSLSFTTYEIAKLPGVGYKYPLSTFHVDKPEGEWPDIAYYAMPYFWGINLTVHLPNCEMGKDTCVRFRIGGETERVPYVDRNGFPRYHTKYTSTFLTFRGVIFPENIRRLPMPRFQPRTATDTISCHIMKRAEVKTFTEKLQSKDIYSKVKDTIYGDGAGTILSLKWFYGIRPAISTPQTRRITLGNVPLDVSTPVFAGEFLQLYMGGVFIGGKFGDYRDYTNVRIQIFIPLLGTVELDPSVVTGKTLHLLYTVNLTDGSAIVTLSTTTAGGSITKSEGWYECDNVVFTTSMTYGYEIPLNVNSIRAPSLMVGEIITKSVVGGVVGAIAGNIPGAVVGAATGAAAGVASGVQTSYSAGSLTPNSNVMGEFTPFITYIFNEDVSGDISNAVGRPSGKVVKVGAASGYLKAAMVYGTPSITMQHSDEIVNMLKEGIYIS